VLGANGAGKSMMLKVISGLLRFENGRTRSGRIEYDGEDISAIASHQLARRSICMSARGVFGVAEGLQIRTASPVAGQKRA